MRYSLVIVFIAVLSMMGCKPTVPSEYIQPGDLEDILYDYHVAQAMADEKRSRNSEEHGYNRNVYFQSVLKKYGISEAEFDSSLVYYYSHADRLKSIYQRVKERLNDEAKALGASVGDINKYSAYSATGDTANVWQNETDVLLTPHPTSNRYDIYVKADTSYYKGDTFMFQFMSDFIYQSGSRDAIVCLVAKYENDSTTQTISHISVAGQSQVRIPQNQEGTLKELRGFIYLGNNDRNAEVRKMLFISQIQLIRFHSKTISNESKNPEGHQADSLSRAGDATGHHPDTTRRGVVQRESGKILSPDKRAPIHRMDAQPLKAVQK